MAGRPVPLVRESDATDERVREAFRDIKNALRIPVVSVVFQAYAALPKFIDIVWRRLRPSVLAPEFSRQAQSIDRLAQSAASAWPVTDHSAQLRGRGMTAVDLARMREIVEAFEDINPRLLIVASAVELALNGATLGGTGANGPSHAEQQERGKEFRGMRTEIADERDAPPRVRAIFEDIKNSIGLAIVSNDYRAMASFPDWLEIWWKDCKARMQEPAYAQLEDDLANAGREAAKNLPQRFALSDDLLSANGIDDVKREELRRINEAFVGALPRLIINIEIARLGLGSLAQF